MKIPKWSPKGFSDIYVVDSAKKKKKKKKKRARNL
jgi:hypothetical protein